MELDECKRKFAEFQNYVTSRMNADVRDNCNNIDALMKVKADLFKDLTRSTSSQG